MSSLVLSGDTSGAVTMSVPTVAGTNTISVQAATGTMSLNTLATAQASTSGTSIDFTGLPAWVKRITVMFNGVSTNSTSPVQVQFGTGSTTYTTTGYVTSYSYQQNAAGIVAASFTTGFGTYFGGAADARTGQFIFTNITGNTWVGTGMISSGAGATIVISGGSIALAAALTAVRITTVNGTDTFDAGSINILYEG
jgi:hypothetical protein